MGSREINFTPTVLGADSIVLVLDW